MVTRLAVGRDAGLARVMLVDDSAVIRGIMRRWIDAEPTMMVVATAINGQEALKEAARTQPDIIILDLEMPVLSGLEALPQLSKTAPNAKILIASTLSTRNARISLQAMNAGATDYLAKPQAGEGRDQFKAELISKLVGFVDAKRLRPIAPSKVAPTSMPNAWKGKPKIIGIGASTGGPRALTDLLSGLKGRLSRISVMVTQHMPRQFTELLGEDLANCAGLKGGQAKEGEPILPGHLYLAPGGAHMRAVQIGSSHFVELDDGPPINFCKPAVDPMFQSLATLYGEDCMGVVLTGMGSDGAIGAKMIRDENGYVLAQDEASSAVWGMPGAAVAAGAAHAILPVNRMIPEISKMILARGLQ